MIREIISYYAIPFDDEALFHICVPERVFVPPFMESSLGDVADHVQLI